MRSSTTMELTHENTYQVLVHFSLNKISSTQRHIKAIQIAQSSQTAIA
jgi:hypothetical protein